jgi:phosphonate transport system substrate-binding protein
MVRRKHYLLLVFAIITLLNFLSNQTGASQPQVVAGTTVKTISLGIVSEKPRERIKEFRGFVDYLAERLSSTAELKGNVVVARTARQLATLLNEKKVDFYIESPYPTFLINEQTGGKLLLRRWKAGRSEYRSLIFTKRNSGITRLEDLEGKIIVFEDPGSTSGYFLPKAFFHRKGFKLTEKSSFQASVSSKEIGYVFAHGHENNVVNWVLLRRVAAGAFSDNDFDELDDGKKTELTILAETETVPRHLLSVRKDLEHLLVIRLKETLLAMHHDKQGRKILKEIDKTTKFDLLPGGEEMMYEKIRELSRLFQSK